MKRLLLGFIFLQALFVSTLHAQETTGILQGKIVDVQKEPIAYATILVTELATNARFGATSQDNGYYQINNLPPSGNYQIEIAFLGYQTVVLPNIVISLGNTTRQDISLVADNITLEEIVVTAGSVDIQKSGNEVLLSKSQIDATPTINRSIQDLTKNLAENNLNSFGGASNRFNNLNIDGIANNDVIGFQEPASGAAGSSANGTPGSLSRSQPIGLGAIKQLVVKIAPFDASVGNFSGANIDLVTKSGTNNLQNEVYLYGNNQSLLGKYAAGDRQIIADFTDVQFGVGSGGALKKDKVFYFINFEQALSNNPVLNALGSSSSNISAEEVELIAQKLQTEYDYDPALDLDARLRTNSSKLFTRLDFSISDKHKLSIRNNFVKSFADNLERSSAIFNFGNQGYRHNSTANSLALELKSNYNQLFNKLTVGFNKVHENRDFDGRVFPHIQIATNSTNRVFAGTYREASVYTTDFSTFQIANKLSYISGKHNWTLGGLVQYNRIDYGFLSAWNGRWEYRSLDDFLADQPARIRGVYNIINNDFNFVSSRPSASIDVLELGLYAQDKIRLTDRLDLTAGIRLDAQYLPEALPISEAVLNTPEFSHFDNKLAKFPQINPRVAFNYNFDDKGQYKLRGGTGLFSGRIPYLWFAYMEYISGTNYFNIDIRPTEAVPLTENLSDLSAQQPALAEINLLDKDFTIPREWKSNIALEIALPGNWKWEIEGTYTKVLTGIFFQSINRRSELSNFQGADNRPYFTQTGTEIKINPNFTNVFLLSNSDQGYRYNITFRAEKKIKGYTGHLAYTYGKSKDISSTVRSSPAANFEWNQALFGNQPNLSFSNFDLRHKLVSSHYYQFNMGENYRAGISLLYNIRSGSPFSFVYQGDVNRDGSSRNDIVYVPATVEEINLVDIKDATGVVSTTAAAQWQQLDAYISNNAYLDSRRGNYAERNAAKTPWNQELDMKLQISRQFENAKRITISLDMLNVLNFLNKDWGRLVFVPNVVNSSFSLLNFVGIAAEEPQYQFNLSAAETPWVVDAFNSRWRAQLGVKVDF